VLPTTYARTVTVLEGLAQMGLDFEIVWVNDGSSDRSSQILDDLAARDPRVCVVHLTRNFGHQPAVCAGLMAARGDVVAILDADLQDPPEVLPGMLQLWRDGAQVVYAVRKQRKEGLAKRFGYWAFYRLMHSLSDTMIPVDSGDFCVMDRHAVDLLNQLPERQRFIRGLRAWIGLKQAPFAYERDKRAAGQPSYTPKALIKLAIDGLISFSDAPLRAVMYIGLLGVLGALLLSFWVVIALIFDVKTPRGWASLASLVLLLSSLQLITLGILGEYIAKIFLEAKGRPTYLTARITSQVGSRAVGHGCELGAKANPRVRQEA
jgi:dolichol-phosphate mannosyltransferase